MAKRRASGGDVLSPGQGLGELLALHHMFVPPYQRHYAWDDEQVSDYVEDLTDAIDNREPGHFFGTVVMCARKGSVLEVIDGQQRLATTFVLLAVIRDRLQQINKPNLARRIQDRYIEGLDLDSGEVQPRLSLNVQDNPFFQSNVVTLGGTASLPSKPKGPRASSTKRLHAAIESLSVYARKGSAKGEAKEQRSLLGLVAFIERSARVIPLVVPDEVSAYTVFETLNDRGVDLAVADLLKNFLFSRAGNRVDEVSSAWSQMNGVIDSLQERDAVVQFVSHYWSSKYGLTRRKLLLADAKSTIKKPRDAVKLAEELRDTANTYVALTNPAHSLWSGTSQDSAEAIRVLSIVLRVVQIRPLLLSIVEKFPKGEQVKALRLLANCAVRIIVAGVRGGTIERMYNTLAHKVHKGDIDKATKLRDAMKKTVPADQRFIEEFEALRINRAEVARYYLAKLERAKVGDAAAGVTDATPNIGLEHVLPETFDQASWQSFTSTTHREWRNSIGNLCLLNHKPNNALGNRSFAVKAPELGKSIYKLTSEVASAKKWTSKEIEERAVELAKLAPTAWPLDLRMT